MKYHFIVFCMLCATHMFAKTTCDYKTSRFAVSESLDQVYGVQANWEGNMDTLKYDIFKPIGDNNTQRPILMLVHGGGFSSGNKADVRVLCKLYASRGFVAVALGYRLGFVRPFQFNYPFVVDQAEIYRAIYRSQQDAKGAIRLIKSRHLMDSTAIDQFHIGGFSAGGIIALGVGYFNNPTYKPSQCAQIGDATNSNGTWKRPDLGDINGNMHINGYDAKVQSVFNFFGAIHDTSIILPGGPKLFQYHQSNDPVVPCGKNKPYHGMGSAVSDNYPVVFGSCQIEQRLKHLGNSAPENATHIHNGNVHDVHDPLGVNLLMVEQLNKWICQATAAIEPANKQLTLYPNPTKNKLVIPQLPADFEQLTIYDMQGKIIKTFSEASSEFDILGFSNGTYMAEILTKQGKQRSKFIVNK